MDPVIRCLLGGLEKIDMPSDPNLFLLPEPFRDSHLPDQSQVDEARFFPHLSVDGFDNGFLANLNTPAWNLYRNIRHVSMTKKQKLVNAIHILTDYERPHFFDTASGWM